MRSPIACSRASSGTTFPARTPGGRSTRWPIVWLVISIVTLREATSRRTASDSGSENGPAPR